MLRFFAVGALVFAADRLSKSWIAGTFEAGDSVPVWSGVFHLTYVLNPGAAFSLFPGSTALLVFVSVLVMAMLVAYVRQVRSTAVQYTMGLIFGGGIGNLFDRISLGAVIDFLDFRIWPVFNLADTAIVCGVILLGYMLIFRQEAIVP